MRYFAVVRQMKEWIDEGRIGEVQTAWCRHFVGYGGEAYFRDWHADGPSPPDCSSKGLARHRRAPLALRRVLPAVSAMGKLMVYGDIEDRQGPDEKVTVEFRNSWPPRSLTKLNPVVDVEDVNMMLMELDNGVLASYQQCHFTPDAWRNYTIIGTEGRIENFGDAPGKSVRLWNHARFGYAEEGDLEYRPPEAHGRPRRVRHADRAGLPELPGEWRHDRHLPLAARQSVAAGVAATQSVRSGATIVEVPHRARRTRWSFRNPTPCCSRRSSACAGLFVLQQRAKE